MKKISITILGHRTSVSLEDEFYAALNRIAARMGKTVAEIIGDVDRARAGGQNLSSALRVFILKNFVD